jgi:hypothetical protein
MDLKQVALLRLLNFVLNIPKLFFHVTIRPWQYGNYFSLDLKLSHWLLQNVLSSGT